jgi:hypothetical protein
MSIKEPTVMVHGEPIAQQRARALIGWLPRPEAIHLLLGRNPAPGEDLTRVEAEFESRSKAVAQRPKFVPTEAIVSSTPLG